ncbi:MAG: hypothetical protein ABI425_01990 [Patescibacteria group bacterium]
MKTGIESGVTRYLVATPNEVTKTYWTVFLGDMCYARAFFMRTPDSGSVFEEIPAIIQFNPDVQLLPGMYEFYEIGGAILLVDGERFLTERFDLTQVKNLLNSRLST